VKVPILFIKKSNNNLRFYVNYRDLNEITIKNRYLLSRIDELLDRLNKTNVFIKLDLRNVYYRIKIYRDDE
jgi:hypothetical protein